MVLVNPAESPKPKTRNRQACLKPAIPTKHARNRDLRSCRRRRKSSPSPFFSRPLVSGSTSRVVREFFRRTQKGKFMRIAHAEAFRPSHRFSTEARAETPAGRGIHLAITAQQRFGIVAATIRSPIEIAGRTTPDRKNRNRSPLVGAEDLFREAFSRRHPRGFWSAAAGGRRRGWR